MIAAVATSSFARRWLGTWLPDGWTTTWYTAAWKEFQLDSVLWVTVAGRARRRAAVAPDRRAGRVHAGAARLPRQARADAAVPAAADGAADHVRHSARDGAVQGPSRRNDLRRDPRQPDSRGAVRDPGHDAVHRADRSQPRIRGARVRRRHRSYLLARAGAAARAGHPRGVAARAGAHDRDVRAHVPAPPVPIRRRWSSRSTTRCSPPACARRSRSTRWR